MTTHIIRELSRCDILSIKFSYCGQNLLLRGYLEKNTIVMFVTIMLC